MARIVSGLGELQEFYDAFVFDQWGVMHKGVKGNPAVCEAMVSLREAGKKVAVLSNSGRRVAYNALRLKRLGFGPDAYDTILTSGEALWLEADSGRLDRPQGGYHVVSQDEKTTKDFVAGLDESLLADSLDSAGGVMLLGLPDGSSPGDYDWLLGRMAERGLPMVCGNPDSHAPTDRGLHPAPGYVCGIYEGMGGKVSYYGKPYPHVFKMVIKVLGDMPVERVLMIGDNMATDIAGAQSLGMATMLVTCGVHEMAFEEEGLEQGLLKLVGETGIDAPTHCARAAVMG